MRDIGDFFLAPLQIDIGFPASHLGQQCYPIGCYFPAALMHLRPVAGMAMCFVKQLAATGMSHSLYGQQKAQQ